MRQKSAVFLMLLCLCAAAPASAQAQSDPKAQALAEVRARSASKTPAEAEVREYIRLYGYREMLELGAGQQLASIIEVVRQSRPDLPAGVLEVIEQELQTEIRAESESAVAEMVVVFQRNLTTEDVRYLNSVGRDPRMQRVVALQGKIARDMEGIGERLGEAVTAKAGPRIEERLRKLQGGREL